ncbi:MAG: hypothetical protein LBK96_04130, partial [Prevotellaceae bacterium]|nr:hypothetical protein [Prevotellaceae bacterium]
RFQRLAIVFESLWFGNLVLNTGDAVKFNSDISLQNLGDMIFQYIIGSIILATLAGSLMFLVSYALLSKVRKSLKN